MTEEQKNAKQRIFDAALSLFAQKGYAAVGVREIAEKDWNVIDIVIKMWEILLYFAMVVVQSLQVCDKWSLGFYPHTKDFGARG